MEVAVCGEVVSFGFPIVEGTLYLAVDFSQFCEAECVIPPMHVRDKVCKGFLLVAHGSDCLDDAHALVAHLREVSCGDELLKRGVVHLRPFLGFGKDILRPRVDGLVAQLLLRPPLLDGGYFLRSPGCVSCRSFLQKRKTCVEFLLLQR